MSRSRVLATSIAALLLTLIAQPLLAQESKLLDAIGTLDYTRGRPAIQVGSWVKYHLKARSERGATDDYTVTVMIAGEEEFWGEECFWVETWSQWPGGLLETAATLMSYSIFEDSLPERHVLIYQRKRILELDENGSPVEQLFRRGTPALKGRTPPDAGLAVLLDTLGTDTVKTARGEFVCLKVRREEGVHSSAQSADSTQYTEVRDVRVRYLTPQVPLSSLAREELEYAIQRRTWLTGRSRDASPLRVMDRSKGAVDLLDFGTGGLAPKLVPEEFRRPLAEQRAAQAARAQTTKPRVTAPKPGTRGR